MVDNLVPLYLNLSLIHEVTNTVVFSPGFKDFGVTCWKKKLKEFTDIPPQNNKNEWVGGIENAKKPVIREIF